MHNVMVRQIEADEANPTAVPVDAPSPIISLMEELTDCVRNGKPMGNLMSRVERYCNGNQQLLDIMTNLDIRHQADRLVGFRKAQFKLEQFLQRALDRRDLNPSEALVFLGLLKTETGDIRADIKETLKVGVPVVDAVQAQASLDWSQSVTQAEVAEKYKGTTPMGRDIVNKLVISARKKLHGGKGAK